MGQTRDSKIDKGQQNKININRKNKVTNVRMEIKEMKTSNREY